MKDDSACMVVVTAPSQDHATQIVHDILTRRLAACAQIQSVTSTYWWDGKITSDEEKLITFKTTRAKYDALEQAVIAIHSYDTPEILQIPVTAGSAKYLAWLAQETN